LLQVRDKWGIGVLDLWAPDAFNDISDELRSLYMLDPIHPSRAGYREWWGPEQERQLLAWLSDSKA
jgi:lysophospholipase L1-like esterase